MKKRILFLLILLLFVTMVLGSPEIYAAKKQTQVRLNVQNLSLTKGNQYKLRVYNAKKNYKIYFTSSNGNIVSIGSKRPKGRKVQISAENIGTATIDVKIKVKKRVVALLSCQIEVTPPAISIKFSRRKLEMVSGDSLTLRIITKPSSANVQPIFESSNTGVVQVNAKGRVCAMALGEAIVTATLPTGQKTQCRITVTDGIPWDSPPTHSPQITERSLLDINSDRFIIYIL